MQVAGVQMIQVQIFSCHSCPYNFHKSFKTSLVSFSVKDEEPLWEFNQMLPIKRLVRICRRYSINKITIIIIIITARRCGSKQ